MRIDAKRLSRVACHRIEIGAYSVVAVAVVAERLVILRRGRSRLDK